MRTLQFILQKEFIQLFRNKVMVRIIFIIPFVQMLILAYTATFEIKTVRLHVADLDRTKTSRDLAGHFSGSPFYKIVAYSHSEKLSQDDILKNRAHQVLTIPEGFEKDLLTSGNAKVQIVTNAIDGAAAALMNAYTLSIIQDFNINLLVESTGIQAEEPIKTTRSFWFNPELNYINYMVPGILVLLVTIIGMFMSGMNLVKEKETGTIEQINVTPIRKYQFIIGKLLPYWIVGLVELAFGLVLAKLIFDIPIVGNVWLIFLVAAAYLLVTLAMALFVSTKTNTQQQAMFLSWFFLVVFILMSGLFTPVDSMPRWAKVINTINPVAYFIEVIRMIMLKGSGFTDILRNLVILTVYGIFALWVAVWQYRKTT
ncbi:MAG TPA: ABC transporter permease [Bacteroidales bacterium]|nr:ABC transporter permease [Bacteroidales bacterium]HPI87370.1 ABC transporter permease [Bacteroidales bacterium]